MKEGSTRALIVFGALMVVSSVFVFGPNSLLFILDGERVGYLFLASAVVNFLCGAFILLSVQRMSAK